MERKKALILGFIGLRPAVAYSCLEPLLPWFHKQYGGCDLRLAATIGSSERYVSKLRDLFAGKNGIPVIHFTKRLNRLPDQFTCHSDFFASLIKIRVEKLVSKD